MDGSSEILLGKSLKIIFTFTCRWVYSFFIATSFVYSKRLTQILNSEWIVIQKRDRQVMKVGYLEANVNNG